jgi:glycosyltransferase involved in cell wall biosynthesis
MNIMYHHRTRGRGAEGVHIMGIVKALRELSHDVSILSYPGADPEKKETIAVNSSPKEPSGIMTMLAKLTKYMPQFLFELLELAYNLVILVRFPKYFANNNCELIYERYSLFMFASIWYANKKKIPIVIEVNDSVLVERVRPLLMRKLSRRIEKWCFKNATGIVFISSYFERLAHENYGEIANSVVSPNAADPNYFDPNKYDALKIKDELGLSNKTVCGYVGAFVKWHGIVWFMEEISPLLKKYENLALLLIGDGVCYEEIADLVKKHNLQEQVIMTGKVQHDLVPKYIAAMDYGILPDSNLYGSSMKHFEFMAMGKGMVVPAFEPMQETVENGVNSWLFPPNDKKSCVDLTLSLATKHEELIKVGNGAREYIIEQRQWRNNALDILTLVN